MQRIFSKQTSGLVSPQIKTLIVLPLKKHQDFELARFMWGAHKRNLPLHRDSDSDKLAFPSRFRRVSKQQDFFVVSDRGLEFQVVRFLGDTRCCVVH